MTENPLIRAESLEKMRQRMNVRIIDCRFDLSDVDAGQRAYGEAHIPNAAFLDLNGDLAAPPQPGSGRHPLPDVAKISATLGALGVDDDTAVVVYDSGNGAMAARAWWVLRWLGHDKTQLLDGGFSEWVLRGLPTTSSCEEFGAKRFVANVRDEMVVTTKEIEQVNVGPGGMTLVDARDAARFAGDVEPIDSVAGHVPGAVNFPFPMSLGVDGCWRSRDELEARWQACLGGDADAPWVAMCGSGVTACHLVISAILAGYREPKLYVGSWSEWITDRDRPVAVGSD